MYKRIIVGGGAAGVFAALCMRAAQPGARLLLMEKSATLLAKVRVSGGGRCNVTHACFDPKELVGYYPRGRKELIGPFHRFQPRDMIEWLAARGVALKTERDGRVFPVSDSSETIIRALLEEAERLGVEILLRQRIEGITKGSEGFSIALKGGRTLACAQLLLATGSSSEGYAWSERLGHRIEPPVPSLFTFNIPTSPLKALSGVAVDPVELRLEESSHQQRGPLLITHFGFSGPAVLKLSAWGARFLHEKGYQTRLIVCWVPALSEEEIYQTLRDCPAREALGAQPCFKLPKKLWKALLGESAARQRAEISPKTLRALAHKLSADAYLIEGKTTHKEEFVTCGGVALKEVDFKTMESRLCPGLFFAGEILDIDGVTGGFNFQNAWTTAFLSGGGR